MKFLALLIPVMLTGCVVTAVSPTVPATGDPSSPAPTMPQSPAASATPAPIETQGGSLKLKFSAVSGANVNASDYVPQHISGKFSPIFGTSFSAGLFASEGGLAKNRNFTLMLPDSRPTFSDKPYKRPTAGTTYTLVKYDQEVAFDGMTAKLLYSESDDTDAGIQSLRIWAATGGTVTITEVGAGAAGSAGSTVAFTIAGSTMAVAPSSANSLSVPNKATGTFTLEGSGKTNEFKDEP